MEQNPSSRNNSNSEKKFLTFYGTRNFITVFIRNLLNQMNPIQALPFYFLAIHSNIILPWTPTTFA